MLFLAVPIVTWKQNHLVKIVYMLANCFTLHRKVQIASSLLMHIQYSVNS